MLSLHCNTADQQFSVVSGETVVKRKQPGDAGLPVCCSCLP